MSKFLQSLFSVMDRKNLSKKVLLWYRILGVAAIVFLLGGISTNHHLVGMCGSSLGVFGMIWMCGIYEIKTEGLRKYAYRGLARDIALSVIWSLVIVMWANDIYGLY